MMAGMRGPAIGFDPERLRQARARAGLTQADVAERLGLRTATAITNWETGRRVPAVGSLRELARVLQVDPLTLIAEATADPAERTLRDLRARKGLRQMGVAGLLDQLLPAGRGRRCARIGAGGPGWAGLPAGWRVIEADRAGLRRLPDSSVDAVVVLPALFSTDLAGWPAVVVAAARLLVPGGLLVCLAPDPGSGRQGPGSLGWLLRPVVVAGPLTERIEQHGCLPALIGLRARKRPSTRSLRVGGGALGT